MSPNFKYVVRPPAESFRLAVSLHPERDLIDPQRALAQHARYCSKLLEIGAELVVLAPDPRHPDSCFTQDPAVVLEGRALIGRSDVSSRQGEGEALEAILRPLVHSIERMEAPATLEGGDIIALGNRLLVGRSTRTNEAGVEALTRFAGPLGRSVHAISVPRGVLHLSTAATVLSDQLVMGLDEVLDDGAFRGMEQIRAGNAPLAACNVLVIGNQVIASGDYELHNQVEECGFNVHRLDLSDFERADAGPTCLSLVIR